MPFRDDLLNPISDAKPAGVNLRYDAVADQIKEARREDFDAPQGDWKSALKVADYAKVIKLAGEALAKKGKDVHVAVWLVDAHVRREGFAMAGPGFKFLHDLLDQFWDTLYPEIEDGDAETRAAPLEWLGTRLPEALRGLAITSNKLTWISYKNSRTVGFEEGADTEEKRKIRKALIEEGKPTGEEFDQAVDETPKDFCENMAAALDEGTASLAALIELCDAKFGNVSPSFVKTRECLEEISRLVTGFINKKGGPSRAQEAPPEEAAPEEAAVPSDGSAAAAPAPVRAAGPIEPVSVEDAAKRLAAIARYLRQQDQFHIGPYLILRGLRFGEIRYNGPQVDANMLEPPSADLRKKIKAAAMESNWDGVLEATETAMEQPCGRAWLDVQRYAVRALEAKGEYHKFLADAVRTSLRGLLTDIPGLEQMTLLDDTPAANPETLAWIRDEVMPQVEAAAPVEEQEPEPVVEEEPAPVEIDEAPPSMDEPEPEPGQPPDVFEMALEATRGGRLDEAVALLSGELERARSGRVRFKRRMQLAHILMASGREKIAYPILQSLAEEIDRRALEDWEPGEVLAHPLALLLKCATSLNGDDERTKAIYARICRLDPQQALRNPV
jgi:type VI secretion system protein ImpA